MDLSPGLTGIQDEGKGAFVDEDESPRAVRPFYELGRHLRLIIIVHGFNS